MKKFIDAFNSKLDRKFIRVIEVITIQSEKNKDLTEFSFYERFIDSTEILQFTTYKVSTTQHIYETRVNNNGTYRVQTGYRELESLKVFRVAMKIKDEKNEDLYYLGVIPEILLDSDCKKVIEKMKVQATTKRIMGVKI